MEANDNREGLSLKATKAHLHRPVENIDASPEGRPSIQEVCRMLEGVRPGPLDQAHARNLARRAGMFLIDNSAAGLPDLSSLDYAGA